MPRRGPSWWRVLVLMALVTVVAVGAGPASPAAAYTTVFYNGAGSAPHIGLIGDSTLAAVRLVRAYEPLRRYNFTFDAEECRRTTTTSCGNGPENALTTLRRLRGQWGSVLVMMTGYNDPGMTFASSVDAIMTAARRQGIKVVIWLTMRTAEVVYPRRDFTSTSYGFDDNNRILLQMSRRYPGILQIANWAGHSADQPSWVASDGIHLTATGAAAVSTFIANQVDRVFAGAAITPPAPWQTLRRGSEGRKVAAAQRVLIRAGIRLPSGATGVYGRRTEAAVRTYQERKGIRVTGTVTRRTARVMGIYHLPPRPPALPD
jgi:hypothetical protein